MAVSDHHPLYDKSLKKTQQVTDTLNGGESVTKYLRRFADEARNKSYRDYAIYYNVPMRTVNSLLGAAMRKPATIELPSGIDYFKSDADSEGNSLQQLAGSCIKNVLRAGRHGLLVDYPRVSEGLSAEDIRRQGIRPYVKEYMHESIINWDQDSYGLKLIVLKETESADPANEFSHDTKTIYRVLRLTNGIYTQQIYDDELIPRDLVVIRDASGNTFNYIPFYSPGASNNSIDPDYPPLFDLSEVAKGHYRNSASYEEGVHMHGQPFLHIDSGETSAAEFVKVNGDSIGIGATSGIVTQKGSAALVQAAPNSAAFEAMTHKESQMIQLGGRLIQKGGANETAEAVRANNGAEMSVLGNIVANVEDALRNCVEDVMLFAGVAGDYELSLNQSFFDEEPNPQIIAALMGLQSTRVIPAGVVYNYLRRTEIVDRETTDEEMAEMLSAEVVAGLD